MAPSYTVVFSIPLIHQSHTPTPTSSESFRMSLGQTFSTCLYSLLQVGRISFTATSKHQLESHSMHGSSCTSLRVQSTPLPCPTRQSNYHDSSSSHNSSRLVFRLLGDCRAIVCLYQPSYSLRRSSTTTLTPTSHGQHHSRHVPASGDQPDGIWKGRCASTSSRSSMLIPSC